MAFVKRGSRWPKGDQSKSWANVNCRTMGLTPVQFNMLIAIQFCIINLNYNFGLPTLPLHLASFCWLVNSPPHRRALRKLSWQNETQNQTNDLGNELVSHIVARSPDSGACCTETTTPSRKAANICHSISRRTASAAQATHTNCFNYNKFVWKYINLRYFLSRVWGTEALQETGVGKWSA